MRVEGSGSGGVSWPVGGGGSGAARPERLAMTRECRQASGGGCCGAQSGSRAERAVGLRPCGLGAPHDGSPAVGPGAGVGRGVVPLSDLGLCGLGVPAAKSRGGCVGRWG